MRTSLKSLLFYLIVGVVLLNLYFLGELYFQHQDSPENNKHPQARRPDGFFENSAKHHRAVDQPSDGQSALKSTHEFLVLDWTGHQHIFREQDPIKCKSSATLSESNRKRDPWWVLSGLEHLFISLMDESNSSSPDYSPRK